MPRIEIKLQSDSGKHVIKTWATTVEDGINIVCKAENCPPQAVLYARVVQPSIYEIKRLTSEIQPYYFSRKTLSYFGQKVSDFKVTRYSEHEFLISAVHKHGTSQRIFNSYTNELKNI